MRRKFAWSSRNIRFNLHCISSFGAFRFYIFTIYLPSASHTHTSFCLLLTLISFWDLPWTSSLCFLWIALFLEPVEDIGDFWLLFYSYFLVLLSFVVFVSVCMCNVHCAMCVVSCSAKQLHIKFLKKKKCRSAHACLVIWTMVVTCL